MDGYDSVSDCPSTHLPVYLSIAGEEEGGGGGGEGDKGASVKIRPLTH